MSNHKIAVDRVALRRVLQALVDSPHLIREMQATRKPEALFPDNPINVLLADFEAAQPVAADVVQVSSVGGKYSEVLEPFFDMMNAELHANAHKGDRPGWLSMDRKTALLEIYYHLGKLHKAVHGDESAAICEYAADVANMSMMLVDICALLATRQADGGSKP